MSSAQLKKIEIAIEEAVVNIIHYGYGDKLGFIEMTYCATLDGWVSFTLKDNAPPFNPKEMTYSLDSSRSLEERKIGGYGIPFMHALMDIVEYQREGEKNILTLKKKISR